MGKRKRITKGKVARLIISLVFSAIGLILISAIGNAAYKEVGLLLTLTGVMFLVMLVWAISHLDDD